MGSWHESYTSGWVWNHPLPENYLWNVRSQPMTPQYSNESYKSTASSAYSDNVDPMLLGGHTYNDGYGSRHGSQPQMKYPINGPIYGNDSFCISPIELDTVSTCGYRRDSIHLGRVTSVLPSSKPGGGHRHGQRDSISEKDRPHCPMEDCTSTFSRKADVNRHLSSIHHVQLISCDIYKCSRVGENGFARHDHLLEHKRGYHGLPIPKRNSKGKDRHDQ